MYFDISTLKKKTNKGNLENCKKLNNKFIMSDDLPSEYDLVVVGTGRSIKYLIKDVNVLIFLNFLNFLK